MSVEVEVPLYKGEQGVEFILATYPGKNTSGLIPYGKNILVRVDECSPVTSGGIHRTPPEVWKMTMQSTTGCICSTGAEAFRWFEDGTPWVGPAPKVGDRICFTKYAGDQVQVGVDGHTYRFMDYRNAAGSFDVEYLEAMGIEAPGMPQIVKAS